MHILCLKYFSILDLVDNETAMAVAIAAASVAATASSDFVSSTKKSLSQYSVAALALLGELLAPMLDIIYSSEEKEKVIYYLFFIYFHQYIYLIKPNYIQFCKP